MDVRISAGLCRRSSRYSSRSPCQSARFGGCASSSTSPSRNARSVPSHLSAARSLNRAWTASATPRWTPPGSVSPVPQLPVGDELGRLVCALQGRRDDRTHRQRAGPHIVGRRPQRERVLGRHHDRSRAQIQLRPQVANERPTTLIFGDHLVNECPVPRVPVGSALVEGILGDQISDGEQIELDFASRP